MDALVCARACLVSSSSKTLMYLGLGFIAISAPGTENQNKDSSSPSTSCSSGHLLGDFWTFS